MTTSLLKQNIPAGDPYYEAQTAIATNSVTAIVGSNICGNIFYQIASTLDSGGGASADLSTYSELKIDQPSGIINVYSWNQQTVGTHTATVTAYLETYPSISTVKHFTIVIQSCIVTSFTMLPLSPTYDLTYTISSSAIFHSISFASLITIQVPACGKTKTFSTTIVPNLATAVLTSASIDYTIYTADFSLEGQHKITVTSTLDISGLTCKQDFFLTASVSCSAPPTIL